MQLTPIFLSILSAVSAITVSYDTGYDDASRSLATVSCSDGSHGFLTQGYTTQGSLPSFPRIGGASTITGWNSASCGKCYKLYWKGKFIHVLAIDRAGEGFNIGKRALDELTNGQGAKLGRVDASWREVGSNLCGL